MKIAEAYGGSIILRNVESDPKNENIHSARMVAPPYFRAAIAPTASIPRRPI